VKIFRRDSNLYQVAKVRYLIQSLTIQIIQTIQISQVLARAAKAFPAILDRFREAVRAAVTATFRDSTPMAFREAAAGMAALIFLVRMFQARMLVAEDPAAERV
jgi:hypothetical protein